jgi:GNAT superfamily N-acetyltransferase
MSYRLRSGTLNDLDALVHQRIAMFADMGVPVRAEAMDAAFRRWLADTMPAGTYRAWVVETDDGQVVAGGGITILPWPPGPLSLGSRMAFAYNVYTEPTHRKRGLARLVMSGIEEWCRENGISAIGLNASQAARHLYESMGFRPTPSPMMVAVLEP